MLETQNRNYLEKSIVTKYCTIRQGTVKTFESFRDIYTVITETQNIYTAKRDNTLVDRV